MSESAEIDMLEWRERIGVNVMRVMTCAHANDAFGPGAVCAICFANAQRIGALIEQNGHDLPCSKCEFEQHIQPRLAQAWREGAVTALDFAVRDENGIGLSLDRATHPNPYEVATTPRAPS